MIVRIIREGTISWGVNPLYYESIINDNPSHKGCIVEVCFNSGDTNVTVAEVTKVIYALEESMGKKVIVTPCKGWFSEFGIPMRLKEAKKQYNLLVENISPDVVHMPFYHDPFVELSFMGETLLLFVH